MITFLFHLFLHSLIAAHKRKRTLQLKEEKDEET